MKRLLNYLIELVIGKPVAKVEKVIVEKEYSCAEDIACDAKELGDLIDNSGNPLSVDDERYTEEEVFVDPYSEKYTLMFNDGSLVPAENIKDLAEKANRSISTIYRQLSLLDNRGIYVGKDYLLTVNIIEE